MKREKIDALNERDILYGLITSERFCREICPILEPRLLEVDYARVVSSWIKDYYNQYKTCPKMDITKLYRSHVDELNDDALKDNVLMFLDKLDRDYDNAKSFNEEYALQQAVVYLKRQSLKNLSEDVDSFLLTGDVTKAEDAITKYKAIEKSSGEAVSILNATEVIIDSYDDENEVLFTLPKAYGKVVGRIHSEDFISFLAPMKRGKTFALLDVATNAMQQGLKVVFVTLEMSEKDMVKRIWTNLTGETNEDRDDINYSHFVEQDDKWFVEIKTISRKRMSANKVAKTQMQLKRMFRGGDIRVLAVPAYSLSPEQLDVKLERLAQDEGFVPQVIVVDYADIMQPSLKGEYRHQIDSIWKSLRSLAQKRKCVVFTASQSDRSSIGRDVESENLAEDIRKLAHVTSMVAINQSSDERKNGIVRLKQLAIREGEMEYRQAVCTQCLSIGRFVTDSRFDDEVILESDDDDSNDDGGRRSRKARR